MLRIKFSGGRQFSSPKSPTSCSCKTLAVIARDGSKTPIGIVIYKLISLKSNLSLNCEQQCLNQVNNIFLDEKRKKIVARVFKKND